MAQQKIVSLLEGKSIDLRYKWVNIGNISKHMQSAVIAAEDQRF